MTQKMYNSMTQTLLMREFYISYFPNILSKSSCAEITFPVPGQNKSNIIW